MIPTTRIDSSTTSSTVGGTKQRDMVMVTTDEATKVMIERAVKNIIEQQRYDQEIYNLREVIRTNDMKYTTKIRSMERFLYKYVVVVLVD